jgi:general secretion pathway protein G
MSFRTFRLARGDVIVSAPKLAIFRAVPAAAPWTPLPPRRAHAATLIQMHPHSPRSRPRRRRAGFTLIEIMVVIVVIAILATLVAPEVFKHVGGARESTARSQVEMLGAALDAYRLHVGKYPTTQEGLQALRQAPAGAGNRWRGPYLRKDVPLDPWGNPYVFRSPGEVNPTLYDLSSFGADGQPGGEGENADIKSWE